MSRFLPMRYSKDLLSMIMNRAISKKMTVKEKASEASILNQALSEKGMLTINKNNEKNAVNTTVTINSFLPIR